jgi:hypothetical protein
VQSRTKRAIVLAAAGAALFAGLAWRGTHRPTSDLRGGALDAVPAGALLVATADLDALRASPVGGPFLREGREIPGLGKVRDVCGLDPVDTLHEVAVAVPAAGDSGEFGLVAAGAVDDEAVLACAAKVISARGGAPVVTSIGSFRSVRDATQAAAGGEIAVRKGGPLLLGGGVYLRAMIDAADGRAQTIRSSVAHSRLAGEIGAGAVRVTVVLTPEQRKALAEELESGGQAPSPGASVVAGGLAIELGPAVVLHGLVVCESAAACGKLAEILRAARDARAADIGVRVLGFGAVLEQLAIEAQGEAIHARVSLPADEASKLVERALSLRGFSHPMPKAEGSADAPPVEDAGAPR